ncbi:fatty acyl-CoA synthetase [Blastococcus sp. Marseille-P5729]|uniref:fatty acyl-CoA synthetase n=1 Tax=Blastococcus sp. Marseille-P5729 TaxID=2086582 RepID=UPI000D0F37D4|nr:fatty acyl-CoA synthetase [Blastococcus sp. Marseille-P5729]
MSLSMVHHNTIDTPLARQARRVPRKTAVTYADRSWTYRELDDAVSRVAKYLGELGLQKGDRVAAYGQNSDAYVILYYACGRAGMIHVPLNYALTGGELEYLIEDSGATAIFVDPHLEEYVDAISNAPSIRRSISEGEDSVLARATAGDVPELEPVAAQNDLVQLLYTSGTTSRPKGSMMTHRAFVFHLASNIVALDYSENDINVQCMPLYHSAGMHDFLEPFIAVGATTHLLQVPDIPKIMEKVEEVRATTLFLAPTVWVPLTNHPDFMTRDLSSLQKAYYGASIMPVPVVQRLMDRMPQLGLYNCFGQSEIGPLATVLRPEEHEGRMDSCGRAVLYVEMRVVDAEMNDVAPGETGEVVYRSPQLCEGYWNKPEATEEAFAGGWFHSGDLARIDEDGYITVVDRIKDVINTGGVLVASREVEDCLYTHEAVAEAAVIGLPDEKWIEAITAYVVLKPDQQATKEELIEHTKQSLAKFKIPKDVRFVDELPRNQSGKLLKRVLRDQA